MSANFVVTVGYDCDPDTVEQMLAEVVRHAVGEVPGMLDDPEPAVAFEPGFGESGMIPKLRIRNLRISNGRRAFSTAVKVYRKERWSVGK